MDSLKWFNSLLRKAQVCQATEMTSNTATARETSDSNGPWAHTSHLHNSGGQQRSVGFVVVGPNSILLAQETRANPWQGMLKETLKEMCLAAEHVLACMFHGKLACLTSIHPTSIHNGKASLTQALAALSPWWSEVILPLYTLNQHRNKKTQLLQGKRVLWGEKHGYAASQNNQFILPDKSAHLYKRLFPLRVSLDLHTEPWRVTLINGADCSSQFQFVVLQYNWLPLNTLWARAGRSPCSPLLIFLPTPSDTPPA